MDGETPFDLVAEPDQPEGAPNRRLKLWEIPNGYHCSIVGTCLSQTALVKAVSKVGLRPAPDAADYEVHGFFVDKAGSDNPVARLMTKMLDAAASGELRRFARVTDEAGLRTLWDHATREGRVAPAYWALLSHPLATKPLRSHAHGEVHMLSHLMAGQNRGHLDRRGAAERRCRALSDALEKQQKTASDQIAALCQTIATLEAALAARPAAAAIPAQARQPVDTRLRRLQERYARLERKLAIERQRSRSAEAEVARLSAVLEDLPPACPIRSGSMTVPGHIADGVASMSVAGEAAEGTGSPPAESLRGRSILYVGGRSHVVNHLKSAAGRFEAEVVHHDGGVETSIRTLDALIERCDLVCCPIDCISHDACRRAKQLCKRLNKPFIPLRSSGAAGFFQVLRTVGRREVVGAPT